ncbi:ABC-type branched-chain amino acid transport system, permease component [Thermomonospora echinospora]|uniref:ABC-type branched-chain amino acid transport system, permease component n=1 Tax=Thermomonospora echinospora TaxID=1992 RepID=A0A1H6DT17_9ACTN|nr:ABC transporter permease [Thermomonospora echinospora]SEG88507.1 ABC-type branched-chain amino acid transport system, permease component [Thermomonospora echinospora]
MLQYLFAGLALGAIYAIASVALVATYVSSGVFNFALGSMAFTVARFYYFLNTESGWPILPSAVVSLGLFAPALGAVLYWLLFRHLRLRSPLIKVVATIGLSVALPPAVELVFGKLTNVTAPGLAPVPLKVFHPFGAAVNMDQIMTYLGLVVVLVLGIAVLQYTDLGLKVRALVDSEALTSLSGVNPTRVSLGVWAVSTVLTGLAGILLAPTAGLSVEGMTYLMAAAFAAVVAARLNGLATAVAVALAMGVVTTVIQRYLDPESALSAQIVPSIPFAFMLLALLYHAWRRRAGEPPAGGALDRAIRVAGGATGGPAPARRGLADPTLIASGVALLSVAALPLVLPEYWAGLTATGLALAIALLSYTLVTGEGGMIWLCQITFAGMGAVLSAELATYHGWPPLLAVFVGALLIVVVGAVIGLLTIRLGDLYVALVTLTFGLLVQTLLFTRDRFYNFGQGTAMPRPGFAEDTRVFSYLTLGTFLLLALLIVNLRRSTAGMAMRAVRWSEDGARTLGLSVVQMKLLVSALATYTAAVGGGFLAMNSQSSLPDSYNVFSGLVWLAVLVTVGSRSLMAALVAGLSFHLFPGVFQTYLPTGWAEVPVLLFGLGAVMVAKDPDGILAVHARQLRGLLARRGGGLPQPSGRPAQAALASGSPDSAVHQLTGGDR